MIYLASPYSHPDAKVKFDRFRAVCKLAGELIEQDYVVFCPIAHSHPIEVHGGVRGGWDLWAKQDLPMLDLCDELHVACFPGWEDSEGVRAEIRYWWATKQGARKPIVYHHYEDLPL